jgi:hypothetical protein
MNILPNHREGRGGGVLRAGERGSGAGHGYDVQLDEHLRELLGEGMSYMGTCHY